MYSSYISTLYNGNFVQLALVHSIQFNEKNLLIFSRNLFSFLSNSILCMSPTCKAKTISHSFSYLPTYLNHAENCS
jgi:hypothetical protein